MDHRKSDRRNARRYEAVEPMWGTVGLTRELTLRNISRGGIQIVSPSALQLNSAHTILLPFLRYGAAITARVRYSTPVEHDAGAPLFHVGLEFIAPSPAVVEEIDLLVATIQAST
jgi:hypothetical protein